MLQRLAHRNIIALDVVHDFVSEQLDIAEQRQQRPTKVSPCGHLLYLNRWTRSRAPRCTPHVIYELDLDLRVTSISMLRQVPMYVPAEYALDRRLCEIMPASLVHQFANAAQVALERRSTVIRYPLLFGSRLMTTEARVVVPCGTNTIRVEARRLQLSLKQ